jgi:hypothetical protein
MRIALTLFSGPGLSVLLRFNNLDWSDIRVLRIQSRYGDDLFRFGVVSHQLMHRLLLPIRRRQVVLLTGAPPAIGG